MQQRYYTVDELRQMPDWVSPYEIVVRSVGSSAILARLLGITDQRVHYWSKNGIPAHHLYTLYGYLMRNLPLYDKTIEPHKLAEYLIVGKFENNNLIFPRDYLMYIAPPPRKSPNKPVDFYEEH